MKWYYLFFGGLIFGFILGIRACSPKPINSVTITHTVDSVPSTPKLVSIDRPVYIDTGSYHNYGIPILLKVDTGAIVARYRRAYKDVRNYRSDSVSAVVTSVVTMDSIYNQEISIKNLKQETCYNNVASGEHRSLWIGLLTNFDKSKIYQFAPALEYESKTGIELIGSYDLLNKSIGAGIVYRIQLRK